MIKYLNIDNTAFKEIVNSKHYVDKSLLIKDTNEIMRWHEPFMCVTRPRKFGKTTTLSMLNAYYSKGCNSACILKGLKIESDETYSNHLNKHNVFYLDMAKIYKEEKDKNKLVVNLKSDILNDLKETFKDVDLKDLPLGHAFEELVSIYKEKFIFLIDEWDILYRLEPNNYDLIQEYMHFLTYLFKTSHNYCFGLVYMTGILPIRKTALAITIYNFEEYYMNSSYNLKTDPGFTLDEVEELCNNHKLNVEDIKKWYQGYYLNDSYIFNPYAVITAITNNECSDYSFDSDSVEFVTKYLSCVKNKEIKEAIQKLINGEYIKIVMKMFNSDLLKIDRVDSVLAMFVHYGFLAYDSNREACYMAGEEAKQIFISACKHLKWRMKF